MEERSFFPAAVGYRALDRREEAQRGLKSPSYDMPVTTFATDSEHTHDVVLLRYGRGRTRDLGVLHHDMPLYLAAFGVKVLR